MSFDSLRYIVFFLFIFAVNYYAPPKRRWIVLLCASVYYYLCWHPAFIVLLFLTTASTFLAGLLIRNATRRATRLGVMWAAILLNLGILFFFKYLDFFFGSIAILLGFVHLPVSFPKFDFLLPLGISFYTLKAFAYVIDVYREKIPPERHFGIYALFVSFFPQLSAGPIERPSRLLAQFNRDMEPDYARMRDGFRRMGWGFFKKVVIADRLGPIVNHVYAAPETYGGVTLLIAALFFSLQIYADFSAYSDIAIGSTRALGYDCMENFTRPYFAASVRDFWRRWHISLTSWFRDYLYIPLGGNRVSKPRWYANVVVVFLVSGLWHGASWTFIAWGGLHALYMLCGEWFHAAQSLLPQSLGRIRLLPVVCSRTLAVLFTFALVTVAWIFFRAESFHDAFYIVTHLFDGVGTFLANTTDVGYVRGVLSQLGAEGQEILIALAAIGFMLAVEFLQERRPGWVSLNLYPVWLRWGFYYSILAGILFLGSFNTSQGFIYVQF